jgi:CheY-like chemotaxis protein
MPDGGRLTIETANAHIDEAYAAEHDIAPGQYVMIAVTDTGCGMTPEVIKKAIDPFFTTKPVGRGTGLGLSQVFGFAKQSGGHMKIYSEVGIGTTMKIYLPRDYGTNDRPHLRDNRVPRGSASDVILLVEDDASVREVHTRMLEELDYTVIAVDGPLLALAVIEERLDVRLLFTDIVTAQMNGRKLADEARIKRAGLPVVFTTGYSRNAVVQVAQILGAYGWCRIALWSGPHSPPCSSATLQSLRTNLRHLVSKQIGIPRECRGMPFLGFGAGNCAAYFLAASTVSAAVSMSLATSLGLET